MSKKDYKLIAKAIFTQVKLIKATAGVHVSPELNVAYALVNKIAQALAEDNPRFNYEKFFEACGF